jgi:hypothetical protein
MGLRSGINAAFDDSIVRSDAYNRLRTTDARLKARGRYVMH